MNITARTRHPVHGYMLPDKEQTHVTEEYVASPPAARIIDSENNVWTVGYQYATPIGTPRGEFAFNVLKNGVDTGEFASRIERRSGRIRIFTRGGYKYWNGRSFI